MPTTGKITGNNLMIFLNNKIISCEDGFELSIDGEQIDMSCKGDGNWGDTKAGTKTWEVSVNAVVVMDALQNGFWDIANGLVTDTEYPIEISSTDNAGVPVKGDKYLAGTVAVTSTSLSGNRNEKATWTATLSGRGPLVVATRPTV